MDFGIFGFSPEQAQEMRAYMANQQAQFRAAAGGNATQASASAGTASSGQQTDSNGGVNPNGNNNGAAGGGDQGEEPVLMHNSNHNGVVCDICNSEIRGFRYKCMQCADYDLCSKCEQKGHHAGHIMMRIAFPEQARDAIRKYLTNAVTPPPSPPHHGHGHGHRGHHGPHHGHHGLHGMEGHPLFSRRGRSFCHRRSEHGQGPEPSDNEQSDAERPATAPGCPYQMGKKEFKRWSKWMKKAAAHQHRSAEAYARAAAASGNNAPGTSGAAAGTENGPTECPNPMDFTAVASQIQEFLNYWGVPVDVVELYDQFGNRGQPTAAGETNQNQATGTTGGQQSASTTTTVNAGGESVNATANATTSGTQQEQQPASPTSAATANNLSENMEQMRIDDNQNQNNSGITVAAAARAAQESLLMDLDAENSGWTIVNNQSREQSPGNSANVVAETVQPPTAPQGSLEQPGNVTQQQTSSSSSTSGSSGSLNQNGSTPFASAGSNTSIGKPAAPATTPTAPPPSFPAGVPNVPLYPVLNQPQIQQILQGVSSAVNSVVRSIPIVTDPRGPMGTTVTNSTPGQVPSSGPGSLGESAGTGSMELDARSMKTLNQLLAMGFSNEGGYLTRLVVAKKGDLEAVLSSLFPN